MAKMTINGFDELELELSQLGAKSTEIGKRAVRRGAGILADEIRKNLEANIQDPSPVGKHSGDNVFAVKGNYGKSTGDLLDSLGVSPADVDKNGIINSKVGFSGYDRKGVPNALKARAMESGTSTLRKRPFIRPAVNAVKGKVEQAMENIIDGEQKKIVKE